MKSKNTNTSQKFETYIGVDLGDRKHHICVTDKKGVILGEFPINNDRTAIKQLCDEYPKASVALEVGSHSPWVSRFLTDCGMRVTVAMGCLNEIRYQPSRFIHHQSSGGRSCGLRRR